MTMQPKVYKRIGNLHFQYLVFEDKGPSVSIGYESGGELHVCRLDALKQKTTPLRGIFNAVEIPELSEEQNWCIGSPRDEWVFSMLCANEPGSICRVLCIPEEMWNREALGISEEQPAISRFLHRFIDERATSALSRSRGRSLDQLEFYSGDSERAVRRRQAAESYPIAANILATDISAKIAIDRAKPLAPVLQKAIGKRTGTDIGKAVMKRLSRTPMLPENCNFETVAHFASLIPLDWIPSELDQWTAFCQSAECLLSDLDAPVSEIQRLTSGRSGDWVRMLRKICVEGGQNPENGFETARNVMQDAHLMVGRFADMLILPLAAGISTRERFEVTPELRTEAMNSAFEMLFSNQSAIGISDTVRRWNYSRNEIDEAIRTQTERNINRKIGDIGEDSWPAVTEMVVSPSGIELVPLVSNSQLDHEGMKSEDPDGNEGLGHCIASYKEKARRSDCHIVSIRKPLKDGRFKRLSTVEFKPLNPNRHALKVSMHRGKGNRTPDSEARDALTWYQQSVATGRISINFDRVFAFQEKRLNGDRPLDNLERLCGYDWKDERIVESVAAAWQPYMTDHWKCKTVNEICKSSAVSCVAEKILPDIRRAPALGASSDRITLNHPDQPASAGN